MLLGMAFAISSSPDFILGGEREKKTQTTQGGRDHGQMGSLVLQESRVTHMSLSHTHTDIKSEVKTQATALCAFRRTITWVRDNEVGDTRRAGSSLFNV